MAAPTIIQQDSSAPGAHPFDITLPGVTAGSTLVALWDDGSSGRMPEVFDDQSNRWMVSTVPSNAYAYYFAYAINVAGGTTAITFDTSAAATCVSMEVFELSPCQLEFFDTVFGTPAGTTHYGAQAAGIDIAADSIAFALGRTDNNGSWTAATEGAGWTKAFSNANYLAQYRSFASASNGDRGSWTSTAARVSTGSMLVFRDYVGGGGSGGGGGTKLAGFGGGMIG